MKLNIFKASFQLIIFLIINNVSFTYAQMFEKVYDDNIVYEEYNTSTIRDNNNIYILSNIDNRLELKKTDNNGNVIWIRQYIFNNRIYAFDLEFLGIKDIVISATIENSNDELVILKVNKSNGAKISLNFVTSFEFNNVYALNIEIFHRESKDFLVLVGSNSVSKINTFGQKKSFVMIYDLTNDLLFWLNYLNTGNDYGFYPNNNPDFDVFNGVTIDNDYNIYAIGMSNRKELYTPNSLDYYNTNVNVTNVVKFDFTGNLIWNKHLGTPNETFVNNVGVKIKYDMIDNNLVLLINNAHHSYSLVKLDLNGSLINKYQYIFNTNTGWELNIDDDFVYVSGFKTPLLDSIFIQKIDKSTLTPITLLQFESNNSNYILPCSLCNRQLNTLYVGNINYFYYPKVSDLKNCYLNFVTINSTNNLFGNESLYMINTNIYLDTVCNGHQNNVNINDDLEMFELDFELNSTNIDAYQLPITEIFKNISVYECNYEDFFNCTQNYKTTNFDNIDTTNFISYKTYDSYFNLIDTYLNNCKITDYINYLKNKGIHGIVIIKRTTNVGINTNKYYVD